MQAGDIVTMNSTMPVTQTGGMESKQVQRLVSAYGGSRCRVAGMDPNTGGARLLQLDANNNPVNEIINFPPEGVSATGGSTTQQAPAINVNLGVTI